MFRFSRRMSYSIALLGAVAHAQNPPPPVQPPVVTTPTQPTAAQQAAQQATGRAPSNEQISTAIRQSGLNQEQIQQRLRQAGYDPRLASPYFGAAPVAGGFGEASGSANADFVQALQTLGILSTPSSPEKTEETPTRSADVSSPRTGGVFGKDIFARSTTVFDPVTSGPVDPAYRLGVGDQLQLVVTGQVELAYSIELRRDGTVVIPQVGQISIAGLTLDAARTLLKDRMERSYSSLRTGDARLDLSIARIRSNAVFVIGEVENPGAYQVNALSTVFHALARAGGPTIRGSFRSVEIRRGNRVISRLDLYDYLLRGDASGDIRLEQGDEIYVPLSTRNVAVIGQVRRPRVFELREAEGFRDLLRFAGDLLPTASVDRVQIDRIVPPERRTPGLDRIRVDLPIKGNLDSLASVRLLDGDVVQVFSIGDVRRNVVNVGGQVFQPGQYELRPAMTLGQLLSASEGPLPWALLDRVKVIRQLPLTGRSIVHSIDATSATGRAFLLEEFDGVEVLDARTAYPTGRITVEGAVIAPSTREFSEGESLRDAIERSGGLQENAGSIDLYRRRVGASYSDTTSLKFAFPVGAGFGRDTTLRGFVLQRDDRIIVRALPGFRSQRFVVLSGEFQYPGRYGITEGADRVADLVRRAGDVLPGAFPESFHLVRNGRDVSVDFRRAMSGDALHNLALMDGDEVTIARDPGTVLVTGAVGRPSLVRYRPGLTIEDYVALAGGVAERGDPRRAVIQYLSGEVRRVSRVAFFFHSSPNVISGATITVPEKPQVTGGGDAWQRALTISSTLASLILAYAAVVK
jgi:polysaccharide export outer membrane protein